MADFNFVTARLATGAAITTSDDVQALLAAGVTDIIDCRLEYDDLSLLATHPDLRYIYLGVADDGQPKPADWFGKGITFAFAALARPHAKVFSHCAAGVNRGPSMAFSILRALGFDAALAESVIRTARPQVNIAYKNDANAAIISLGYN